MLKIVAKHLKTVMNNYDDFKSDDELHVTSFNSIKIIDIDKNYTTKV